MAGQLAGERDHRLGAVGPEHQVEVAELRRCRRIAREQQRVIARAIAGRAGDDLVEERAERLALAGIGQDAPQPRLGCELMIRREKHLRVQPHPGPRQDPPANHRSSS